MLASVLLLSAAFQVGPFYEQDCGAKYVAARPFYAREGEVVDIAWPLFTSHRDWWRFCLLASRQDYSNGDYQFSIVPFWFNGCDRGRGYAGLFPLAGRHPHIAAMYDLKFALWPLWHSYRMPRSCWHDGQRREEWLETNSILFPFLSWRSDGSWSLWPIYGVNRQRESVHRYVLWPFVTWAHYESDRDTAGEGYSWTLFPLWSRVRRQFEQQDSFLPPFFSVASSQSRRSSQDGEVEHDSADSFRLRCPWPFFEYESSPRRWRLGIWPLYERVVDYDYKSGSESSRVTRYGWKLVELYDDQTRIFPFYASGRGYTRLWPLWESESHDDETRMRVLGLFPIRYVPQIDRNWAKFWTFYENRSSPVYVDHSLLWGIFRWRTFKQ